MNIPTTVKFNKKDRPEFIKELRKRVNTYFKEKGISKHANGRMKFKTGFMIALYFTPLILLLSGLIQDTGMIVLMWVLMGFGMSGIGLSIMHDANHGAYSANEKVNNALGYLLNFLGGYHMNWRIQHNVLHHSYTNIDGFDEDIENAVMRMHPEQEQKKAFRFQAFYAPFLYGIMTLYWVINKDFSDIKKFNKKHLLEGQGLTYKKAIRAIIFNKVWYFVLTLLLPIIILPLAWWQTLLCFLMMHFIGGLFLALIFQPAHVIEETDMITLKEDGSVENSWAIHQLRTTANFANGSTFFSWFIGGLNYQIEHHLFPNICHIHYKNISKIVKETAQEFNLPYNQHKTFVGALRSHFKMLHLMGTGKYDEQLATR